MMEKIKSWWSEDKKWFCILANNGVDKATVSLTPEEAADLARNAQPSVSAGSGEDVVEQCRKFASGVIEMARLAVHTKTDTSLVAIALGNDIAKFIASLKGAEGSGDAGLAGVFQIIENEKMNGIEDGCEYDRGYSHAVREIEKKIRALPASVQAPVVEYDQKLNLARILNDVICELFDEKINESRELSSRIAVDPRVLSALLPSAVTGGAEAVREACVMVAQEEYDFRIKDRERLAGDGDRRSEYHVAIGEAAAALNIRNKIRSLPLPPADGPGEKQ